MAEPVEYSVRWWVKTIRAALAEGLEDDEVRKYFGMAATEYVHEADKRRMARHKAFLLARWQLADVLRDAVSKAQKKNAYGEYEALKIDGFARFFRRDNTGRAPSVPSGKLYPLLGAYGRVLDRDELVLAVERAEIVQPSWAVGDALPSDVTVKMAGPTYWPASWPGVEFAEFTYSPVSARILGTGQEYASVEVDLNEDGAISPVGVWLVWVPQRLKVTTYYNGTGETKEITHSWRMPVFAEAFEVSVKASTGVGNVAKLVIVGWEPVLPWEAWGSADLVGADGFKLADMPRVMGEIPDGYFAWSATLSAGFGASAWLSCFERRYWVRAIADDMGRFQYQRPVWMDAARWWAGVSDDDAAGMVASGYTVPKEPRAKPKRRRGVSVQFDAAFIEALNAPAADEGAAA